MNKKLSVLLVVKNEEKQLSDCLESVKFADEVVVILDKCTDKSEEISRRFTKRIYKGSWDLEGDRRNYGIKKCNNDWIMEIDADERASIELGNEIMRLIKKPFNDWYLIPVNNYIGNKIVKYGWGAYFGKSAYPGLFKKGTKIWGKNRVHPKILLSGKKGFILKNPILHYYCKDISDMIIKLDNYSTARSLDLFNEKNSESLLKNLRRIFSRFWKSYFLRKGYKEKNIGIMIALMAALYPLLSYIKYISLKKKDD